MSDGLDQNLSALQEAVTEVSARADQLDAVVSALADRLDAIAVTIRNLPDGFFPPEQVSTICGVCENHYNSISRRCTKAKILGINPVTGECLYETNEEKNQGNCPDYKEKKEKESK